MNEPDPNLHNLLRHWQDIEPAADFDTNVRRRIRPTSTPVAASAAWADWVRPWLGQPGLALAAALAVSVIVGSSVGVLTARAPVRVTNDELRFLSAGTLTGGYLKLVATEVAR